MPNVIVKSPTGQTRSVDVGQVQGFLNQNWTQQGATTEKMGVVSDPNPIAPKPQVVNPKAGLTEVDKQFREAVVPKAEAFANAPVGPAGEDARQIAANTPVVAASGQPELEQALKVRANNLGVPETALSDMMDFPEDTIDTEEIEKDPVDLTGVFSDTTISNNIDKTVNLGLNSIDSTLMNLFKKQQASAEDARIKMEQDQANLKAGFTDLLNRSSADDLKATFEANKVQEKMDALNEIREKMLKKSEALSLGMQQEDQRIAPLTVIGRRQQVLRDQAASELSALNVSAQILQGDLNFAKDIAELSFNALQNDKTNQLNAYEFMISMDRQDIINLKQDEKDAVNSQIDVINVSMARAEANKDRMFDLISNNPTAAMQAGIGLTDDPEEALTKMLPFIQAGTDFEFIKGTDNQAGGVFDKSTGTFIPFSPIDTENVSQGVVSTGGGNYYDIGTYATDPNHEASIQAILNNMGQMNSIEDMDRYIQSVAPGSPITGQMIANSSAKTGTDWEIQIAMMQQDSSLGTAGIGARNFNPGNIAQFDSLGTTPTAGYSSWQEGVDAVGDNLSRRQTTAPIELPSAIDEIVKGINEGKFTVPTALTNIKDEDEKRELLVALAQSESPKDNTAQQAVKQKIAIIDNALNNIFGLKASVGPTFVTRTAPLQTALGTKQDFIADIQQLVSKETLDALLNLKKGGGTLGALSDQERIMLQSAATKIGTWAIVDKNGKVKGYNASETSFIKELKTIRGLAQKAVVNSYVPVERTTGDQLKWIENADGSFTQVNN